MAGRRVPGPQRDKRTRLREREKLGPGDGVELCLGGESGGQALERTEGEFNAGRQGSSKASGFIGRAAEARAGGPGVTTRHCRVEQSRPRTDNLGDRNAKRKPRRRQLGGEARRRDRIVWRRANGTGGGLSR
jgi:hypothetical protein